MVVYRETQEPQIEIFIILYKKVGMNTQTNKLEESHDSQLDNEEYYKIDTSSPYIQNILTKTREAQERVDMFMIMMYQRFIIETEEWDE